MIAEDREMARIQNLKMQQAQADMILSQNEKKALIKRQQEMEAFENEMVRQYAEQQREAIFRKLEQEEMERRAEAEFRENLRNELYVQENELAARKREQDAADKRDAQRREL